ncbi:tripartite tricarboxylate transporter substrate binding protein [Sporomusa termitida]|uniref:Tripartite tricarboxylate transporter family receptor n=1 Tax=Sporomusa termitida TaxID=2377 RepID=A0A517DWZ3_9FIRM|nr:tripartite tricarboxylate transporter substrate binding protein [Sporomusa termitida]QDR81867.1 Tripartite tricarboxylate transporter family receptor [Sporomusa termitida]
MKKIIFQQRKKLAVVASALVAVFMLTACGVDSKQSAPGKNTDSSPQAAANYPAKGIEYVVPYAAGGGVDLVARAVADAVGKKWGQPISVVNRTGGGGAVGAQYALAQPADGYTVLANVVSNTSMMAASYKNPAIKLEDQQLVARIVKDAPAFTVKSDAQWNDFNSFSEWVKQNPEKLSWTTSGVAGYSTYVAAEWLHQLGVDVGKTRMIVTNGTADSLPLIAGGNALLAVHPVSEVATMVNSGHLKILAVSSTDRSPFFPNVPTTAEQGFKDLSAFWWTGLSMPKGTPEAIVKKWSDTLAELAQDPEFQAKLKTMKMEPSYLNTADFNQFVTQEAAYYGNLATQLGIVK